MNADFYTGSLVPPEDLWFRQPFIDELWMKLRNEHVLLTAPRRTGKSSVMNHIQERPQAGHLVVYQNVQDLSLLRICSKPSSRTSTNNTPIFYATSSAKVGKW